MHQLTMRGVCTANTMHATRNLCVLLASPTLAQVVFHPRFSAWKMFCQESQCLGEITSDSHSAATKVLDGKVHAGKSITGQSMISLSRST